MNKSRTIGARLSAYGFPERGCVVLDQPQHMTKAWLSGIFRALWLVFDTTALLSVPVVAGSLLLHSSASAHAQGGVPLWTNLYPNSYGGGISAVDSNGNVFVTGSDGLIKYSDTGVLLWTNRYLGYPRAIAVDSVGSVFV